VIVGETLKVDAAGKVNISDENINKINDAATKGALSEHSGNTTQHITTAEREAWNAKQAAMTAGFGLKIENNQISLVNSLDCGATDGADTDALDCGYTE